MSHLYPNWGPLPKKKAVNRFNVYQDAAGLWRWRLWGGNNQILADGAEGYSSASATRVAIKKNILSLTPHTFIKTTPATGVKPVLLPPSGGTIASGSTM